jgi:hypothetical protein
MLGKEIMQNLKVELGYKTNVLTIFKGEGSMPQKKQHSRSFTIKGSRSKPNLIV